MTKPRGTGKSTRDTTDGDLRAQVHFCAESGHIWLHEHRMLLVHAEAQATLRRELIDTLGMERVQGLLTRMGYAAGMHDAELARTRFEGATDMELFMTGPQLHMLEGSVKVIPVKVEFDRVAGSFYGEFLWENSWEAQWHWRHYGSYSEPVCWGQIGYASGYTTAFMGRPVLYKEVECAGMGESHCRIIGKPLEEISPVTAGGNLGWNVGYAINATPPKAPMFGRLIAWDPVKQKEAWRQEHVSPWNGGTLTTAGNLVFQGTADGRFIAYNATTGEKLWETPTGTAQASAARVVEDAFTAQLRARGVAARPSPSGTHGSGTTCSKMEAGSGSGARRARSADSS